MALRGEAAGMAYQLRDHEILGEGSVEDREALLRRQTPETPDIRPATRSVWFENLSQRRSASLRLFCFPYAGGSTQAFWSWRRHVPPEADLCLVHLPGRGKRFRERPFKNLKRLVNMIANQLAGDLRQPFAFYGHSMGAVICFELARKLRRQYRLEPAHLFLSGRRAPHVSPRERTIFNLPHDEFVAQIVKLNGTPHELLENSAAAELFLPLLRADLEMVETHEYRPSERLSCPISIYGGSQDTDVLLADLHAWREHTSGAFKVRLFPGDHFFIHSANAEFLQVFRDDISDCLRGLRA